MQLRTWFGIITVENETIKEVELFQKDIASLAKRANQEFPLLRGTIAGSNIRELAINSGFVNSVEEYDRILHEVTIRLAREQVTQTLTPDRDIIAAAETFDELNKYENILSEGIREWFILNFGETDLEGEELAKNILEMRYDDNSYGGVMKELSLTLVQLLNTRKLIEKYLRENMPLMAPNLSSVAGPILGAGLLSIAGSLEKLASMPSGTIQVLGANNALFKHLRGKAPSPKHGLIFRHPSVNGAPKWQRGKIARALASKIAIAARYDHYSGELKEDFAHDLKLKVEAIRKLPRTIKKSNYR